MKNGGSDAANGLSLATAWATLQHAADLVDPGDTVHVLDGTYQGFYLSRSGHGAASDHVPRRWRAPSDHRRQRHHARRHQRRRRRLRRHRRLHRRTIARAPASAPPSRSSSPCATVTRGNNGRWGIFTGFADDLLIENNEAHHSHRRARHLRLQQRRPPGHPRQPRATTTTPTAST